MPSDIGFSRCFLKKFSLNNYLLLTGLPHSFFEHLFNLYCNKESFFVTWDVITYKKAWQNWQTEGHIMKAKQCVNKNRLWETLFVKHNDGDSHVVCRARAVMSSRCWCENAFLIMQGQRFPIQMGNLSDLLII